MNKFFICKSCGNFLAFIESKGPPVVCCGQPMTGLAPNTVDASGEKHLPEVIVSGDNIKVQVGSVPHPMTDEHYIQFIYVETEHGGQRKRLKPGNEPNAEFSFASDKPVAVYEYCNLHGLWRTEVQ